MTPKLRGRAIEVPLAGTFSVRAEAIDVAPGITTLRGPSGSGKSTLLRALATLAPFRGTLTLDGVDIWTLDAKVYRRRVALVPQTPPMLAATVGEEVAVGPALHGVSLSLAVIDVLLSDVDLDPEMRSRASASLSGGEKQRLALARALANEPEVLLLDEPTSALDEESAKHVRRTIEKLAAAGRAILLTSHREADLALGSAAYVVLQGNVVRG
jgi:putative ABC transport system ATP-binding protein